MYGNPYGNQPNPQPQPVPPSPGIACNCPKVLGALLAFIGFALAAVGEFLLGGEFGKDAGDISRDDLTKFGIISAVGVLVGGIGYFVTNNTLCSRTRDSKYFGNLLILVGVLCGSAFLFGGSLPLDNTPTPAYDSDVESYHNLAGIAFLLFCLGWTVAYYDAIPCRAGVFEPAALGHGFVIAFSLIASIMFFIFAWGYDSSFQDEDDKDIMMGMRIAIGICDVFIAIGLALSLWTC